MKCAGCGADSLLIPVTMKCAVCEAAKPVCRDCFRAHAQANVHEGVVIRGRGRARAYRHKTGTGRKGG